VKFKRVRFRNFRLLREVEIEFSADPEKRLTVIRAENDSGKTTMLTALQWALFGDDALPDAGRAYRLHPIDWDASVAKTAEIEVALDFEDDNDRRLPSGEWVHESKAYRLIRKTTETIDGLGWKRIPATLALFEISGRGTVPITNPQTVLNEILPNSLRDVFFTDGDRALTFIEASVTTKRQRVQEALKALLGLDVLEDAIGHVKSACQELSKAARAEVASEELEGILSQLEVAERGKAEFETKQSALTADFSRIDLELQDLDKRLAAALRKGDQEQLKTELQRVRGDIARYEASADDEERAHADLMKDSSIGLAFIDSHIGRARTVLSDLKQRGTIPSNAIPILRDRLALNKCICGTSLAEGTAERDSVLALIKEQSAADAVRDHMTELYFKSGGYAEESTQDERDWKKKYEKVAKSRPGIDDTLKRLRQEERELDVKLLALGDTDVSKLVALRKQLGEMRDAKIREQADCDFRLAGYRKDAERLVRERDRLLASKKKYGKIRAHLLAAEDVRKVLEMTQEALLTDELEKVSAEMDRLFHEMIVGDLGQQSIIQHASITRAFDIEVVGPEGRTLDPDRDLNGASRRALTLAFIFALSKVSQVVAPNVIDTPLGMMSGLVKRSVLEESVKGATQLVLFLTRSEIKDCEDIVTRRAGRVLTMTNAGHFPRMLVHRPSGVEKHAFICNCSPAEICSKCERIGDREGGLQVRVESGA